MTKPKEKKNKITTNKKGLDFLKTLQSEFQRGYYLGFQEGQSKKWALSKYGSFAKKIYD